MISERVSIPAFGEERHFGSEAAVLYLEGLIYKREDSLKEQDDE